MYSLLIHGGILLLRNKLLIDSIELDKLKKLMFISLYAKILLKKELFPYISKNNKSLKELSVIKLKEPKTPILKILSILWKNIENFKSD